MLGPLKVIMGEFSYFLEKYLSIKSVLWTYIFMAFWCAVVLVVPIKIIEIIVNKKKNKAYNLLPVCFAGVGIFSYYIDILSKRAYLWNSLLQRVISNFEYVLSFESNKRLFLEALNLPNNEYNSNHLSSIAMFLNSNQWRQIIDDTGGNSWYFEKIYKSMNNVLGLDGYNLALKVMKQGYIVFLSLAIILLLALILVIKKQKISAVTSAIVGLLCIIETLGGNVFTISALWLTLFLYLLFSKSLNRIMKMYGVRTKNSDSFLYLFL